VLLGLSGQASDRLNAYAIQILVFAGCNVILAVSLNLINGHAGQFSIGHAGFMAIGAYLTAWISVTYGQKWLEPFDGHAARSAIICVYMAALMVVGGLGAAVGGVVIGLPSLRRRGDYLAIATLGFGEIIKVLLLNVDAVGGARGLAGVPQYTTLFLCFGTVVVTVAVLRNLVNSVHGRALLAIREDETAAEAVGIDCARYKTSAFVIGAFFAGAAGCLYAHYLQFIHPRSFDFMKSIELVLIVVLGGTSTWGVIIAAVGVTLLPEGLRQVKDVLHLQTDPRMVIYSVLLIAAMLLQAKGVFRRLTRWRRGGATAG
jgi:branched-chain amino acid transport system permease protein